MYHAGFPVQGPRPPFEQPGVPTPYAVHVHPYPTRFHGGIWRRPVFGKPYVSSPQAVFKPSDFYEGNPGMKGLGAMQYQTHQGIYGGHNIHGGGIYARMGGLGAICVIPNKCKKVKQFAPDKMNTSLIDNMCDRPAVQQGEISAMCNKVYAEHVRPREALTAGGTASAAEVYPWRSVSEQTKALQRATNILLRQKGYVALAVDGKLGPATCGAIKKLKELGMLQAGKGPPSTCLTFTDPRMGGAAPGPGAATPGTAASPGAPMTYKAPSKIPWGPIGAGVAGMVVVGILAIALKK